jgi:hypothetical protein
MACGTQHLAALGGGDAGRGAAETVARAHTHFDEYQRLAIARDQVYFTDAAGLRYLFATRSSNHS